MSSFIKGLGLDLFDFRGKFICVAEEKHADANFCLGALMWQALSRPGGGACLLALHHSLQHYYHTGMRLGYNLSTLLGTRFEAVDALELLDKTNGLEGNLDGLAKSTFLLLKSKLNDIRKNCKNVFFVIDDLSDFLNMGLSPKDVISFIQYIRISLESDETLVVCSHCNTGDPDQEFIKNFMFHICDLRLDVKSLDTGFSKEVSGSITLTKRDTDNISSWSPSALYHYKTGERTIKVFSPGNISFSYTT